MSGFDINEASNYFLRYPTAQGPVTFQNATVSGNLSVSGNTTITATIESTSTSTGALIVSGGIGIAKNLYVSGNIRQDVNTGQALYTRDLIITDLSGTAPISGDARGEENYLYGNTWLFENKGGDGSIVFQSKNTDSLDTKSVSMSYTRVNIEQQSPATSTTTGALTVVGGISTQNNLYAGGNIIANGASSSVSIYSSKPPGSLGTTNNGILLGTTYPGGVINEGDTAISFGMNTKYFGLRNTTRAGAMIRMDVSSSQVFTLLGQPAGSGASDDPTTYFSIDSNGNALVYGTSVSTTTSTGALQVSGGVGIVGNVNVGDTIRIWDGANVGIIDQSGTTLSISSPGTISMTGNVQVTGNITSNGTLAVNNLLFLDGSTQSTSTSNNDIMSDCDFHAFIYNQANPSTPRIFFSASYALSQTPSSTTTAISANTLYFWPVFLTAGQAVNGVAFWTNTAVSATAAIFRGYDGITAASTRKAISASVTTGNNTMTYANMTAQWIVDWTGIHYVCVLPASNTAIVSTPANSYANFNLTSNLTSGTLSRIGCSIAGSSIPTTTSGTVTTLNYIAYVAVYGNI